MLPILQHLLAVDEHVHHAARVLHRLLVGRVCADGLRVEHHHVRERAPAEGAAVGEAEVLGGEGGQAADGLGEGDDMVLAHELAEEIGEVAVGAGVRARLEEHALGRGGFSIGAERHPRLRDLLAQVVLGHQKVNGAHAAAVLDDQIDGRVLR